MSHRASAARSLREMAKQGNYDALRDALDRPRDTSDDALDSSARRRLEADYGILFEAAVADFRTVKRKPAHLEIAKLCIERGVEAQTIVGWIPMPAISFAATHANLEIVMRFLGQGRPDSPWVWASLGDAERLRSISNEALVRSSDPTGLNLLHYAAASGLGRVSESHRSSLLETCRLLLDAGVDPDLEIEHDLPISPMWSCAASGGLVEVMELLLERGNPTTERCCIAVEFCFEPHQRSGPPFEDCADAILAWGFDINAIRPSQGRTLLHASSNRGAAKAVRWLLARGASPNRLDSEGCTPLHRAAERNGSASVSKMLVEAGADPMIPSDAGQTAADVARARGKGQVLAYLDSLANAGSQG